MAPRNRKYIVKVGSSDDFESMRSLDMIRQYDTIAMGDYLCLGEWR